MKKKSPGEFFYIDDRLSVSLREVTPDDASAIYRAIDSHRKYLETWLPFVTRLSEAGEKAFLASVFAVPREKRNFIFLIETDRTVCGLIGFSHSDFPNRRTEIGYWLLPEYQGKGIMTRCVKRLCQWAVRERDMNRIQIKCAVGNHASNAIPKRLGFSFEGVERDGELLASGSFADINVYSILKREVELWNQSN